MTTQFPQIATTVPAEWLMKEADRRKMGDRIQELREQSPHEQADMARQLPSPKKNRKHMSTRMYQRIEERGTTKWEQVQKIAAIHAKHRGDDPKTLAYWIWSGKERAATPDVIGTLNGAGDRLTRIEEKLDDVLAVLSVLAPEPPYKPQPTRPNRSLNQVPDLLESQLPMRGRRQASGAESHGDEDFIEHFLLPHGSGYVYQKPRRGAPLVFIESPPAQEGLPRSFAIWIVAFLVAAALIAVVSEPPSAGIGSGCRPSSRALGGANGLGTCVLPSRRREVTAVGSGRRGNHLITAHRARARVVGRVAGAP